MISQHMIESEASGLGLGALMLQRSAALASSRTAARAKADGTAMLARIASPMG